MLLSFDPRLRGKQLIRHVSQAGQSLFDGRPIFHQESSYCNLELILQKC